MQVTFSDWVGVLSVVLSLVLTATITFTALWLALRLLRKLFAPSEYPALTMLLAVMGGLVALYQANQSHSEKQDQQARTLQFATDSATRLLFLASFQDNAGSVDTRSVPASVAQNSYGRMAAYANALLGINATDLPSAVSMGALTRARAAAIELTSHAKTGIETGKPANIDTDLSRLGLAVNELTVERDRLYPVFKIGPFVIGTLPQMR